MGTIILAHSGVPIGLKIMSYEKGSPFSVNLFINFSSASGFTMLLTLNLIRIKIDKICRGTVRSTDTTATGTELNRDKPNHCR